MKFDDFLKWVKTAYDKLSVFVVLLALLISVALLIMRIAEERKGFSKGRGELETMPINNAKSVDVGFIEDARLQIRNPFQVPEHTRRLLTSEWRLPCLNCRRPIPFDANICPYCDIEQPDVTTGDDDRDGDQIPDEWEREHGLNPNDPTDANDDPDGDGFSNLEEYLAGTNPFDANSSPPPIRKLRLQRVRTIPISIIWIGTSAVGDGKMLFAMRDVKTGRDYYLSMNEVISGFRIVAFDRRETNVIRGGVSVPRDISVLTVQRGERKYSLRRNQMTKGDVEADMLFIPEDRKFTVKIGADMKLKIGSYKVVDIQQDAVIVSDNATAHRYRVSREGVTLTASTGKTDVKTETPKEVP